MAYTPVNRILLGAVMPVAVYYIGLRSGFLPTGAYVVKGALKVVALNSLSTEGYLAVRTGLGWPVVLGLIGFSFWYPRWCWRESK